MFRSTFHIIGVVVLVIAVIALWHPVGHYAKAAAHQVHQAASDAMPVRMEIDRLKCLIDELDEVLGEQHGRLVGQSVDKDRLATDCKRAEVRVATLEAEVRAAREVLAVNQPVYHIDGRDHTRQRVLREATAAAENLERAREIAAARGEALQALEEALGQAEEQIANAEGQREQYELRLTQLRAQAESVAIRAELTRSLDHLPSRIDDGSFRRVEEAFTRVERKLEVERRALERADAPQVGTIRFSAPPQEDIIAKLDAALADEQVPVIGTDTE